MTTPEAGVLEAHVYRAGLECVYLAHAGAHPNLELDEQIVPGGDWSQSNVVFEDASPEPPMDRGLWRLEWPWRAATPDDGNDLLCCVYIGQPTWHYACAPLVHGSGQ